MSVPLMFLLMAPLVGAVAAVTFVDAPTQRRVLVAASGAAMLGGAAAGMVRAAAAEPVAWRTFSADAWTALLVLGSVAVMVTGVAQAGVRSKPGTMEAVLFAAAAAGVAPLLVPGIHLIAVTLPVGTLAVASAALVSSQRDVMGIPERRAIAVLALSDVAALVALGTGVSSGASFPVDLSVPAGAVLLGAAALRLGLLPAAAGHHDALRADPALASIWLGPVRAQGFLLVPTALAAGRGVAYAAAAAAALIAVAGAARAIRDAEIGAATLVSVSLAVMGLAVGGTVALWGAVLCVAGTFAAAPAWYAAGAAREIARPTLAFMPAGAMIPGAVLVVAAALEAAAVRPAYLAFAIPALAAMLAMAVAMVSGVTRHRQHPRNRADRTVAALWGWTGIAALLAVASLPARSAHGLAFPVADALGVGRLLRAGSEPGVSDEFAVVVMIVAVLAFLVGPGRMGAGGAPDGRPRPMAMRPPIRIPVTISPGAWTAAAAVLVAASIGVAIRIYVVAAGRGFL